MSEPEKEYASATNLVDEKLRYGFLFDVNLIFSKYLLAPVSLVAVESDTDGSDICPSGVFPVGAKNEFVFERMEIEADIPVIKKP